MTNNEYETMVSEMETNPIIDTDCTKPVSGKKVFEFFIVQRLFL